MHSFLIVSPSQNFRNQKALEKTGRPVGHPDLLIINKEDKVSIGIEKIRDLTAWLSLKPFQSKNKVVLIQDAQNLTVEAQNAILKTLEEPPGNCQILLTAPHSSSLIDTIVSRCALIDVSSGKINEIRPELEQKRTNILELIKLGAGERLDFSEENKEIFSDQDQTLSTVDGWLFDLSDLIKSENSHPSINIPQISQLLFELKKDLSTTNVNPRNLIDLFFLQIQPAGLNGKKP